MITGIQDIDNIIYDYKYSIENYKNLRKCLNKIKKINYLQYKSFSQVYINDMFQDEITECSKIINRGYNISRKYKHKSTYSLFYNHLIIYGFNFTFHEYRLDGIYKTFIKIEYR